MGYYDNSRDMSATNTTFDRKGTHGSFFFFSSRRRHTRCLSDWSSDVCSSDLDRTEHGSRRIESGFADTHGRSRQAARGKVEGGRGNKAPSADQRGIDSAQLADGAAGDGLATERSAGQPEPDI